MHGGHSLPEFTGGWKLPEADMNKSSFALVTIPVEMQIFIASDRTELVRLRGREREREKNKEIVIDR